MRTSLRAVALLALSLSSLACVVETGGHAPHRAAVRRPGPPPHAPAHGYRHKHHDHDLVFDSALGVYVVVDLRDVWFLDGSYFRIVGDRWEIAVGASGPWRALAYERVPAKLYKKRHPHGGPPGQTKKQGKSKH
ncbi:MAG: hypothetical protein FJ091_02800 [Deltaproteobacteria bacterium]|nr:hypothetical protein [Deltaproteobacteria bacterium]